MPSALAARLADSPAVGDATGRGATPSPVRPPDPLLAPADDRRLTALGFPSFGDVVTLAAMAGQRRWHPAPWRTLDGYACSVTRERPVRFFPTQEIGRGPTPAAALADAIVRLADPDRHPDLDAGQAPAFPVATPFGPGPVPRQKAARGAAPGPGRTRDGRRLPAGAGGARADGGRLVSSRGSGRSEHGERLRVWLKPVHPWPRVRTGRIGRLAERG